MRPSSHPAIGALALVAIAVVPSAALACATCGCSLSTEAAMGYSAEPGWRASLEFDFINQNQYRTGTHSISYADVAAINDAGGSQEVEKQTINRYITLGLNYIPNPDWNLSSFCPTSAAATQRMGKRPTPSPLT